VLLAQKIVEAILTRWQPKRRTMVKAMQPSPTENRSAPGHLFLGFCTLGTISLRHDKEALSIGVEAIPKALGPDSRGISLKLQF
jgi:hypothetical protein